MKVYLLLAEDRTPRFHFPPPRAEHHGDGTVHRGLRGWMEGKTTSLKTYWAHADRGIAAKLRHVWEWLHRRMPADESGLLQLRASRTIEIHHPVHLSSEEVRAHWTAYLAGCRRRHAPWLAVNTLLSPLTLVLAPLPGPNVIGYWFVYRAVRDLLALLGLRHAAGERVETSLHPVDAPEQALRRERDAETAVGSPHFIEPAGDAGYEPAGRATLGRP